MNRSINVYQPLSSIFDRLLDNLDSPETMRFTPVTDVHDGENGIVIEAELPGVKKDEIKVEVENSVLTISAKKQSTQEKKERFYINERAMGEYKRAFKLHENLDGENVQASYSDGVLRLEIARKESTLPRQITIS
jgi:HSP20 family protein